jgi:outer membrane lipoprotein-sorting protein
VTRRGALLAAAAALAFPLAARAQAPRPAVLTDAQVATLHRLEQYLDGLHSLKARFLQIAPDGAISHGTAWLRRPGRMRFEYDKPSDLLLVAGHGLVVVHDREQTSNIPIGRTPLGLLLRDRVTLSGEVTVTQFNENPEQIAVTLVRTASPGDGSLTLVFSRDPLALVAWSVVDAQGRETRIRLSDVEPGGDFPDSLFTYIDPRFFDQGGNGNAAP